MEITTTLPLILALGARILLNSLVSSPDDSPPSTPDFLLTGLFQGVLLYAALTHLFVLAIPVGFGIAAKLTLDFSRTYDATQCVCTLLGVALGVVFSDVLARIFEDGTPRDGARAGAATVHVRDAPDTSRRLRLVSFGRNGQDRNRTHGHKRDAGRTHRRSGDERERPRDRDRDHGHDAPRDQDPRPLTPALTYASTSPSISLDSVPSSIDPEGRLTPREREIAVLRARASLADSERRRFKEERKWALSQGNYARASQLAWQVRRFTALMESFHREADAKVVEGGCMLLVRAFGEEGRGADCLFAW
ncbi:uncharacterized protein LAESUDRAFT_723849 [Laetiporus sulphureus 93-53]|uniref:Uncharacterized protein n=1 Tax=Laetiporus sulphureus 93-53 TaxID=1314785 RepID=A0A165F466_9APHY|nr:uncharacterized protein LAESUDRAFT_723849 [Laetiporus sulphureus 93-53]KZT08347.1 hypothetical protein LAESUDRAFT_723849 [Laetiporus sulphureus 93-53]